MKVVTILPLAIAEEAMQGHYADPNHPGCQRSFQILNETNGEMFGNDDCTFSTKPWGPLPVTISDTYQLTCDFSSKGGPADLKGVFTLSTPSYITWEDGNIWTQLDQRPTINDK